MLVAARGAAAQPIPEDPPASEVALRLFLPFTDARFMLVYAEF